jgi:uncharacterized protein YijF (DUF1287 family)
MACSKSSKDKLSLTKLFFFFIRLRNHKVAVLTIRIKKCLAQQWQAKINYCLFYDPLIRYKRNRLCCTTPSANNKGCLPA